jgi:hypothetical protein
MENEIGTLGYKLEGVSPVLGLPKGSQTHPVLNAGNYPR